MARLKQSMPVPPYYPAAAKLRRLGGTVVFRAVIGEDGHVRSLTLLQATSPIFVGAAADTARSWIYPPYLLDGQPSAVETTLTLRYAMRRYSMRP